VLVPEPRGRAEAHALASDDYRKRVRTWRVQILVPLRAKSERLIQSASSMQCGYLASQL
jgi:hypothetical protein